MLIRLHGCAGWSTPLLLAYGINRFSHDVADMVSKASIEGGSSYPLICVLYPYSPSLRWWWHYTSFLPWISACYWQIRQISIHFLIAQEPSTLQKIIRNSSVDGFRQPLLVYKSCNYRLDNSAYDNSVRINISQVNWPFKKLATFKVAQSTKRYP